MEAQAAAFLRQNPVIRQARVYIDHPSGPCGGSTGCDANLADMLPEGVKLWVTHPGGTVPYIGTRGECVLEEMLLGWWGPPDRLDGRHVEEEARFAHPAVRDWWISVSKWNRQLATFNRVVPLRELSNEGVIVTFWIENQGDVVWGYDSECNDSYVYFNPGDGWQSTGLDVREFLFRMSLIELVEAAEFTAECRGATIDVAFQAAAGLDRLDLGTIGWLPAKSTLMYSCIRIVEAIPAFGNPDLSDITVAFRDDRSRREWMATVGHLIGFRISEPPASSLSIEEPPF